MLFIHSLTAVNTLENNKHPRGGFSEATATRPALAVRAQTDCDVPFPNYLISGRVCVSPHHVNISIGSRARRVE